MPYKPFTSETARVAVVRSLEARKRNREERLRLALNGEGDGHPARSRISRLWGSLEVIDARVDQELTKTPPNTARAKELQAVARLITAQIVDMGGIVGQTAGRVKAPKVAPPVLPDPEPDTQPPA